MSEEDIIIALNRKSFSNCSFAEKKKILEVGRPTPNLNLKSLSKARGKVFSRKFHLSIYDRFSWLCGSNTTNKLYCWPCLLFCSETLSLWSDPCRGYSDLSHLYTAIKKHERIASHLRGVYLYKTFGYKQVAHSLEQHKQNVLNCNDFVTQNRDILKRLTRVACYLGMQGITFCCQDRRKVSECNGSSNFVELVHCLGNYDPKLHDALQKSEVFKDLSIGLQNGLIEAVNSALSTEIANEVKNSMFLSIMIYETLDARGFSQLPIVLRYVSMKGVVCERFIKFVDVGMEKNAQAVSSSVVTLLSELGCLQKLIALTCNGAAAECGKLHAIQELIKEAAPYTVVFYSAHNPSLVLSQALSHIAKCNLFFSSLEGLASFFSVRKECNSLSEVITAHYPSLAQIEWDDSSQWVDIVTKNRNDMEDVLTYIQEHPQMFDQKTKNESQGLLAALSSFDFNFLLQVYSQLFCPCFLVLKLLNTKSSCLLNFERITQQIREMRVTKFNGIWKNVTEKHGHPSMKKTPSLTPEKVYESLVIEILDTLVTHLTERFKLEKHFQFMELLDVQKFYVHSLNFPQPALDCLKNLYSGIFDIERVRLELSVMYASQDFAKSSLEKLLEFFNNFQLGEGFREVFKLISLVLTFPVLTSTANSSTLKRIESYLHNKQEQQLSFNLALMFVEKSYLKEAMSKETFYEKVISDFSKKSLNREVMCRLGRLLTAG